MYEIFHLFLSTKVGNPHFPTELKSCLVSFLWTEYCTSPHVMIWMHSLTHLITNKCPHRSAYAKTSMNIQCHTSRTQSFSVSNTSKSWSQTKLVVDIPSFSLTLNKNVIDRWPASIPNGPLKIGLLIHQVSTVTPRQLYLPHILTQPYSPQGTQEN